MKTNPVKRKLVAGEPSFGTWLSLGDLTAARFLARSGFDWLTVDIEHSPIDWSTAGAIFGAIADAGCVPLARVPRGDHDHIKRVLDAGAWGIVVPMVDTVEQARAAIAAAKYPPTGTRSVGGAVHCLNFDASPGEYFDRANDEILVVLQTESPTGAAAAEEIYALPGVDAIFVGPNDLKANMRAADGTPPAAADFEATLQHVVDVGRSTGTATGMHVMSPADARARAEQGMQFIAVGSDLKLMMETAGAWLADLHPDRAAAELARY